MFSLHTPHVFQLYETSHLLVNGVMFCVWIALLELLTDENKSWHEFFRKSLLYVGITFEVLFYYWRIYNHAFSIADDLPLEICNLSFMFTMIMLYKPNMKLYNIISYWGIVGAFTAISVGKLHYDYPHFRYFHYFLQHWNIILGITFLTITLRIKPKYKYMLFSWGLLQFYGIFCYWLNPYLQSNYLYVNSPPHAASIILKLTFQHFPLLSMSILTFIGFNLTYLLLRGIYYYKFQMKHSHEKEYQSQNP